MDSAPESVLLVALDNIGDLVFTTALLEAVRERWPRARLGVWCKEYAAAVARLMPGAPLVHAADPVWDKAPGRGAGRLGPFLASVGDVRRQRYELAIVTSRNWRAAFATRLTGARRRVGWDHGKARFWLTDAVPRPRAPEPVLAELARLAAPLFPMGEPGRYRLEAAPLVPLAAALAARRSSDAPYVVLHAFAGHPRRCLPLSRWLAFAEAVRARGLAVVWVGTSAELAKVKEAAGADAARYEYGGDLGDGGILELAALCLGARAFVGHDSGPLHVAGALGAATLGLYLPSEHERTFPQGVGRTIHLVRSAPSDLTEGDLVAAFEELQR